MTTVLKGPYWQHGFWWVDVKLGGVRVQPHMFNTKEIAQAAVDRWLAETGAVAVAGKALPGREAV